MATTDTKQQLKELLRELFQLNNTDLDFGIYRIMNIKSKEVENFITKDLDEKVESVKTKILDRQSGDIKVELDEAKTNLPPSLPCPNCKSKNPGIKFLPIS